MFFAGTPVLMLARRLMHRSCETRVASPPAAAASDYHALIGRGKVEDLFAGLFIVDDCSHGDFENYVRTFAPGFVRAFAVASALGLVFGIEAEVDQRIVALAGLHDHVAALAAVAARRPSARNIFFAAEGHAAVATVAGFDSDFSFIDEHKCLSSRAK